jgi:hypothetical protein
LSGKIGQSGVEVKRWLRLPEFIEEHRRARWEVVEQGSLGLNKILPLQLRFY